MAPTRSSDRKVSRRLLDFAYLLGAALLLCIVGVGAFAIADLRGLNPVWVFLALLSAGFLAFVFEGYRNELRSARFVFFVGVWLVINMAVFVVVVGSFGWLYLFPAMFVEQVLFYASASWLFGVRPLRRRGLTHPSRFSKGGDPGGEEV